MKKFLFYIVLLNCLIQAQNINQVEYYIDSDPGLGLAQQVSLSASPDLTLNFSVDISTTGYGFHTLFLRAKAANGKWSIAYTYPFLKANLSSPTLPIIARLEYFFNTDPGLGQAISLAVGSSTDITLGANIGLVSVPYGFNTIYFRAKDANNKWTQFSHSFYKLNPSPLSALKKITHTEYFIDTDPGFLLASAINITPDSNINKNFSIDLTSYNSGFHTLFIRARDENKNWAQFSYPFFKTAIISSPALLVDKAEYFIDSDPGLGQGVNLPITPSSDLTYSGAIPLESYSDGFHNLYVRARDESKKWTQLAYPFFKTSIISNPIALINKAEYFVDSDPGLGLATNLVINPSSNVTHNTAIALNSYSDGFHTLFLRAQDENKKWTQFSHPFFKVKQNFTSPSKLARIEYFIDIDPGVNLATSIAMENDSNSTTDFSVDLTSVLPGFHTLFLRSIDKNHRVTQYAYSFLKKSNTVTSASDIVKLEYFYTKTGFKSSLFKSQVNIAAPDLTVNLYAKLNGLTVDSAYNMHLTAINQNGARSLYNVYNFKTLNRLNKKPESILPISDFTFNEDFTKQALFKLTEHFNDSDVVHGDLLSYNLNYNNSNIMLQIVNDSVYAYSKLDKFSNNQIIITASDTSLSAVVDTFYININNINDLPKLVTSMPNYNVVEDFGELDIGSLNQYFADADGETLVYSANAYSGSSLVNLNLVNSNFIISSKSNLVGDVKIAISALDNFGSAVDTFFIKINPVNDKPVAVNDNFIVKGSLNHSLLVLSNDIDVENNTLEIISVGTAAHGQVSIANDKKSIVFTSEQGFNGITQFEYVISDGELLDSAIVSLLISENSIVDLNLSIHQNPILDKYSDFYLISDTTLTAMPEVKWFNGNDSAQIVLSTLTTNVYKGSIEFTKNGTYTIRAKALAINGTTKLNTKNYVANIVQGNNPTVVASFDQNSSIYFNRGALADKSLVLASQEKINADIVYEYSGNLKTNSEGQIKIKFNKNDYSNLAQLSIYKKTSGNWQTIVTQIDESLEIATANIRSFGEYKLGIDLNKKANNLIPKEFTLKQNYPNPFNPITTIKFDLAQNSQVSLIVYNILGQKVKELLKGELIAKSYEVIWDATNSIGEKVSSGIYFYQLITPNFVQSKKMVLLK